MFHEHTKKLFFCIIFMSDALLVYTNIMECVQDVFQLSMYTQKVFLDACVLESQYIHSMYFFLSYSCISFSAEV